MAATHSLPTAACSFETVPRRLAFALGSWKLSDSLVGRTQRLTCLCGPYVGREAQHWRGASNSCPIPWRGGDMATDC